MAALRWLIGGLVLIAAEMLSGDQQVIEPGTPVTVLQISGATAIVWAEWV